MNYRNDSFTKKFLSAQKHFKQGTSQDIVSIKYRDNVNNSDYQHFIGDYVTHELNLDVKTLDGNFQGRAWLVSDRFKNQVILVEHETGLEILYIAGSIASIISLIPVLSAGWKSVKGHFPHGRPDRYDVEIRRLTKEGKLIERHIESVETHLMTAWAEDNKMLSTRVDKLEREIARLKKAEKRPPRKRRPT